MFQRLALNAKTRKAGERAMQPAHAPTATSLDDPLAAWPGRRVVIVSVSAWLAVALICLATGPPLSTHEVLVAQIARQILQSGDWIVLRYLDAPFLIKPPLPPWLAAVSGWLLPPDAGPGLPVTQFAARLPSLLATLATGWITFALARSMFGARIAACSAFVYATCIGTLLFALNATAEALLTLFCTWAFAEFWWSRQAAGRTRRLHQLRFYVAFGLAMLSKAPMPLAIVAVPLAAWWWFDRATRLMAGVGIRAAMPAARLAARDSLPRLRLALTDLGLWWGVPLVAGIFLPWMFAVARREPYVWQLWIYEYLDRFQNENVWSRTGGLFYYLPAVLGMTVPWTLSLPEAIASPFLAAYRADRRPLTYAAFWVGGTLGVLSLMAFKQHYYVLPLLPGCALLLGPVLHRFFFGSVVAASAGRSRIVTALALIVMLVAVVATWLAGRRAFEADWEGAVPALCVVLGVLVGAGVLAAVRAYVSGRRSRSFGLVGLTSVTTFVFVWLAIGPRVNHVEDEMALVQRMQQAGLGATNDVFWTSHIPNGRIVFYGNQPLRQVADLFKLRADQRGTPGEEMMLMVGAQIRDMLAQPEPVHFVFERQRFGLFNAVFRPRANRWFEIDRWPPGPSVDDWLLVSNMPPPHRSAGP